ncbi:MAG: arsenite methyltransferase [Chloroflexota bacterium]
MQRNGLPPLHSDQEPDFRQIIQERYTEIAERGASAGQGGGGSCCEPAAKLYTEEELGVVTSEAAGAAAGCGNPTALAELKPGERVLDLGSGGGIDCFLAAQAVGPDGFVIGLDMTPAMVNLARLNVQKMGLENVVFKLSPIESPPEPDNSIDVVISNCVINLSWNKQQVFNEAFRVLKPGGRIHVSDIVLTGELPEEVRNDMDQWASCVAGAQLKDVYLGEIAEAGFTRIEVMEERAAGPEGVEWAGVVRSISVRAVKPAADSAQAV